MSEEEIQTAAEVDAGTLAAATRAKRKLWNEDLARHILMVS